MRITIKEASKRTGKNTWQIREAITSGKIIAYKIGKCFEIEEEEIEKWNNTKYIPKNKKEK